MSKASTSFRMAVTGTLVDHAIALYERREKRRGGVWPDESDIYEATIKRLRVLFVRQLKKEGWTPPNDERKPE